MKRFLKAACLTLLLVFSLSLTGAAGVSAATCSNATDPLACACGSGGGASASAACAKGGNSDTISGPNGVLKRVTLIIALIAGVAAVIVIIVGGLQYILSAGDSQKAASARGAILGAVIGLVIIAAAESIILFVVSKV